MTAPTLLLVDDEPEVLEALRRTLRREDFHILTAANAAEAEKRIAEAQVDIVVSDVDMPGMNGLELLSRLRESRPGIIRIVLTGAATLDSALKAINSGEVHRFLTKPWSKDELLGALRDAVQRLPQARRPVADDAALSEELQRHGPSLLEVERHAGVYVISAQSLAAVAERLGDSPLRRLLEGASI